MDFALFKASLADAHPPSGLSLPLLALWSAADGDWDRAHGLAQRDGGPDGAWVHAYLHRVEGDLRNADHWYRCAERACCRGSLGSEWEAITGELLAAHYSLP